MNTTDEKLAPLEDRAGQHYWDTVWDDARLPPSFDPNAKGTRNFAARRLHRYFLEVFRGRETPKQKLLEIGCGNSALLPYFSKEFGFDVSGLDYSLQGCEASRRMLERENVVGNIFLADLRRPPSALLGQFDVVFSAGVAEHFDHTALCLRFCSRFLKRGGMLVTLIPNMSGLVGKLQYLADKLVYGIHIPLSRESLVRANEQAGLVVVRCDYLLTLSLNVVNIESWGKSLRYKCFRGLGHLLSISAAGFERIRLVKPNSWSSPWICCVATVEQEQKLLSLP